MISLVGQWLAGETQFSGTARRTLAGVGEPYALRHLLWTGGHMLRKSQVLLRGP